MQKLPTVLRQEVVDFVVGDRKYWKRKFRHSVKLLRWFATRRERVRSVLVDRPLTCYVDNVPVARDHIDHFHLANTVHVKKEGWSGFLTPYQATRLANMCPRWHAHLSSSFPSFGLVIGPVAESTCHCLTKVKCTALLGRIRAKPKRKRSV